MSHALPATADARHAPWRRWTARGASRRVATLSAGVVLGQGVTLLTLPLLGRLYGPAAYGTVGTLLAATLFLTPLATLRCDVALVLPEDDAKALDLWRLGLAAALATTVAGLLGALGAALAGHADAIALACGALLLGTHACWQLAAQWALRARWDRVVAANRPIHNVTAGAIQLGAVPLGGGVAGLAAGEVAGRVLISSIVVRRLAPAQRAALRRGPLARAWRAHRAFAAASLPAAMLATLVAQAPVLFAAWRFGVVPAGLFAMSQRLLGMPMSLVGTQVGNVFLTEAAHRAHADPRAVVALFHRASVRLLAVAAPLGLAVALAGVPLAAWVLGPSWAGASTYLWLLLVPAACDLVTTPVGGVLEVIGRAPLRLRRELLRAALLLAAIVPATLASDPRVATAWLALGATAGSVAGYALTWRAVRAHGRAP